MAAPAQLGIGARAAVEEMLDTPACHQYPSVLSWHQPVWNSQLKTSLIYFRFRLLQPFLRLLHVLYPHGAGFFRAAVYYTESCKRLFYQAHAQFVGSDFLEDLEIMALLWPACVRPLQFPKP